MSLLVLAPLTLCSLRILTTTVLGWTTALVGGIIAISSSSCYHLPPTSWTCLALAWFMSCTTASSWTRHMLLLRILHLAHCSHKYAGPIMGLSFPILFRFRFLAWYFFAGFVVTSLTPFSQYGCNVCGWPVFCPSRWPDWVPHGVSGPR